MKIYFQNYFNGVFKYIFFCLIPTLEMIACLTPIFILKLLSGFQHYIKIEDCLFRVVFVHGPSSGVQQEWLREAGWGVEWWILRNEFGEAVKVFLRAWMVQCKFLSLVECCGIWRLRVGLGHGGWCDIGKLPDTAGETLDLEVISPVFCSLNSTSSLGI